MFASTYTTSTHNLVPKQCHTHSTSMMLTNNFVCFTITQSSIDINFSMGLSSMWLRIKIANPYNMIKLYNKSTQEHIQRTTRLPQVVRYCWIYEDTWGPWMEFRRGLLSTIKTKQKRLHRPILLILDDKNPLWSSFILYKIKKSHCNNLSLYLKKSL